MSKSFKYRLMSASGDCHYFASAVQFYREARHLVDACGKGFLRIREVTHRFAYDWEWGTTVELAPPATYVMTDVHGTPVEPADIYREGRREHVRVRHAEREAFERANPRRQPGRRWRKSRYYRAPRCLPALRQIAGWLPEDGEPKPRHDLREIPTQGDDLHRALERSWKRFRKTRWKGGNSKK